jgi:hypothetical protein
MKNKVLDRAMFKEGGMPDVNNVGIMDGFMDQFDEMFEDDMEDEDEYETGKMMDRTPSSPEILMNNLRGDMRSVDARREELADMVGYNAAMETPDEVLALLQAQLAEEQMAGIGGLPGAMPPPPAMPQGAMPMDQGAAMPPAGGIEALMGGAAPAQPPMQMANGGYVQNFADGSDEDGVTPYGSESSYMNVDPSTREMAQAYLMSDFMRGTSPVPSRQAAMEEILPTYQEILGTGDKGMTQAQMLFALSQAAFNYAGNVDAQGRPLRGSQMARAAQAFAPVPGQIGALAAAQAKEDRAVKLAALQAGEKERESIIAANQKIRENQRKAAEALLKESGDDFKARWEWKTINTPDLLDTWAKGGLDDPKDQTRLESALVKLLKPTREEYTDPVTQRKVVRTIPGYSAPFIVNAIKTRQEIVGDAQPFIDMLGSAVDMTAPGQQPVLATTPPAPAIPDVVDTAIETAAKTADFGIFPRASGDTNYYDRNETSVFGMAGKATGPVNVISAKLESYPYIRNFVTDEGEITASKFLEGAGKTINRALSDTDRFGFTEQATIQQSLDLLPKLIDDPMAFRQRVQGIDLLLLKSMEAIDLTIENDKAAGTLSADKERQFIDKKSDIQRVRRVLGAAPYVFDDADALALQPGDWYALGKSGQLQQLDPNKPSPAQLLQQLGQ